MAQPASVEIKAKAGKEEVKGLIELEVDAYVAVVDEVVCANQTGHEIELLMGKTSQVDFLLIRSDVYERPTANGCTKDRNGDQSFPQRYIKYQFYTGDDKPKPEYPLKHAQLFAGELSKAGLPPVLDKIVIDNLLTVDIKISILAARTREKDCQPAKWQGNMPAMPVPAAN